MSNFDGDSQVEIDLTSIFGKSFINISWMTYTETQREAFFPLDSFCFFSDVYGNTQFVSGSYNLGTDIPFSQFKECIEKLGVSESKDSTISK